MENKIKTEESLKDYLEKINNLLEQDEDIKVNSINELIEKVKDYDRKD